MFDAYATNDANNHGHTLTLRDASNWTQTDITGDNVTSEAINKLFQQYPFIAIFKKKENIGTVYAKSFFKNCEDEFDIGLKFVFTGGPRGLQEELLKNSIENVYVFDKPPKPNTTDPVKVLKNTVRDRLMKLDCNSLLATDKESLQNLWVHEWKGAEEEDKKRILEMIPELTFQQIQSQLERRKYSRDAAAFMEEMG